MGWQRTFHPDDLEKVMENWGAVQLSGEPSGAEARMRRFDGEYHWFLVMTTILSGLWSAWTFARLTAVAGKALQVSRRTIDLTAVLSDALEREDDALLLAVSGNREQAKGKRQACVLSRQRTDLWKMKSKRGDFAKICCFGST